VVLVRRARGARRVARVGPRPLAAPEGERAGADLVAQLAVIVPRPPRRSPTLMHLRRTGKR
jgi:hypothetical protein